MSELLAGKVQAGFGDASRWLKLFNVAYREKLGVAVFPGSLNIALDHVFDFVRDAGIILRRRIL